MAATASGLHNPTGVAVDASGNVYIADTYNHVVRKVSAGTNIISTVAGTGIQGYSGDGGLGTAANLQYPEGLALDGAGNLYIADTSNHRIRRVVLSTGVISTVAGNGLNGPSGDGGPATSAQFNQPSGLAYFGGNLYVADRNNHRIRMIVPGGNVTTVAGTGSPGTSGDGGAATSALLCFPRGIAINAAGELYIADTANSRVRKVASGIITPFAGTGSSVISGDGGLATSAGLGAPDGVAVDASGHLFIAAGFIRRVDAGSNIITRIAGATSGYSGDGGVATSAGVRNPRGVAVFAADVYFSDSDNHIVRRVSGGNITKLAGTGIQEGAAATSTHLYWPRNLALDAAGNVYFTDTNSNRVRRLDTSGNVSTFAGNDSCCDSGEGVAPTLVALRPRGVALDTSGNVYISENGRIRKVSGGVVNTIAGNGTSTVTGDGGLASAATVSITSGITVASSGDLYFADGSRIRRIAFGTNIITTVAGTGASGFSGDGGLATSATLSSPSGVAVDGSGNIYVADTFNGRIRRVDAGSGNIATIGGGGVSSADGIAATSAQLSFPGGVRLDASGNLFLADGSKSVRRIDLATGVITTVAGATFGFSGDGGPAGSAAMMFPADIAFDASGNLLIADTNNNRIRRVTRDTTAPDTSITMSPGAVHFNTTALFTFGSTETGGGSFQCSLDGGAYAPCSSTQAFNNLALGDHTLLVRAMDGWGNVDPTPVSFMWKVAMPTTISSSASHALALSADGKVYAWGNDSYGQLGQGRTINRLAPTQVTGLPAITQISMQNHVLAVDSFKQVWSWGDNSCGGQLGPREGSVTNRPARVIGASNMTRVGAALCFSTALRTDGTVWVWGAGTSTSTGLRQVTGLSSVSDIATGTTHALALKGDGTLWAFGDNSDGQLGLGTTGSTTAATQIPGLTNVTAMAAGLTASMAMQSNGTLLVWGRSANNAVVTSPTALPAPPGAVAAIAMSGRVPYVALATGSVHYFHIATGLWASEPGLSGITRLSANAIDAGLAIDGSAQLYAFSDNNLSGQLGMGNTTPIGTPVPVPGFAATLQFATSVLSDSAIAVKGDGSVWFWGQDTFAQSGDGGSVSSSVPLLVAIPGNPVIKRIAAGDRFSVAVDTAGNVWGWGENILGPLGSPLVNRSSAAAVTGISNVAEIAAGSRGLVVYLKADGSVWRSGTLPFVDTVGAPIAVPGLSGTYTAVAAGSSAYALRSDGSLFSWGANTSGDLGVGNTTPNPTPQFIGGISGSVKSIAAGFGRAAAVTTGGTVWTWGSGVLGNGGAGGSTAPVQVPGISDAAEIALGTASALVRRTNGGLQAWGNTGLSDATSQNTLLPFPVAFHEPVRAIALGANHTVGWLVGNAGLAWGFGFGTTSTTKATIGDGSFVARTRPVVVLAAGGAGNLDGNNWYLDLDTTSVESIPAASTPKALSVLQLFGSELGLTVQATVKYKAAEIAAARRFNNYAFALVPAEFFGLVKNAPGTPPIAELKRLAKQNKDTLVLAQLTPAGWTNVSGQLIAYSQSTANAAGSAVNILTGINATQIPGARFCIGYGESSGSMLTLQSLSEVLSLEGATSTSSGVPCVLTGVYVGGASSSTVGTSVTFSTSVVGLSPTGSAQFKDGASSLSSAVALTLSNEAVGSASISTASLATGVHSIGASYGGDSQNAAASATIPLRHEVVAAAPGQTRATLAGPSSSDVGSTATFSATVSGASPTGTVQFKDGSANLGDAAALVEGQATLRTSSLATGDHTITAVYSGDSANATSTSSAVSHTVYSFIATTITLTASASTAAQGGSVTFTATVTGSSPAGTVTFRDGGTVIGTVALSGGSASVTVSNFESGQHAITADYAPDSASQSGNQAVSSSATVVTISVPGELTMTPASYDFGGQSMNTTRTQAFNVFNSSSSAVTVSSLTVSSGFTVFHDCASSLAAGATCSATVVFTPSATGAVTGTLTAVTGTGTITANLTGTGERSLVSHYYRSVLRRAPDSGGKVFWEAEATRVSTLGANINEVWFSMAMSFYFSTEYTILNRDNTGFLTDLYNTFFNRPPDTGGLAFWMGQVANGMPRESVLANFMFSPEFTIFTRAIFGNTAARPEVDAVMDFYRGLLVRLPDFAGFDFYVRRFRAAQCSGAAAVYPEVEGVTSGFAGSTEYSLRNRSNSQYVTDLYNTFLRRGGDLDGVRFWIDQLQTGARTRDQLRREFIASPEFNARVNAMIAAGCAQ